MGCFLGVRGGNFLVFGELVEGSKGGGDHAKTEVETPGFHVLPLVGVILDVGGGGVFF